MLNIHLKPHTFPRPVCRGVSSWNTTMPATMEMREVARVTVRDEDEALMLRVQNHDREAFNELSLRITPLIRCMLIKKVLDEDMLDDLQQDVLLKMYTARYTYSQQGPFRAWVGRIVYSCFADGYRARRGTERRGKKFDVAECRPLDGPGVVSDSGEQAFDRACEAELAEAVRSVLSTMSDDIAQAFALRHFGQLTFPEVADQMQCAVPTAKSRYRIAKENLRCALQSLGYSDE